VRWAAGISSLTLYDVVEAAVPSGARLPLKITTGDLPAPGEAEKLVADRPDIVLHLAAIVSGEAEQDFDKGYRINMDGTRALLEAVRHAGYGAGQAPRVVFTSSIAVFGAPFPEAIGDGSSTRRSPPTGRRNRSASSWCPTTPARASSTA
jgi:nucleoside-diphosphate-sugar epimerase